MLYNVPAFVALSDDDVVLDCDEEEWFKAFEKGVFEKAYVGRLLALEKQLKNFPFHNLDSPPMQPQILEEEEYGSTL